MFITAIGLNHRSAPVEVRENLAFSKPQTIEALTYLGDQRDIAGCTILSTCNRTEVYVATTGLQGGKSIVQELLSKKAHIPQPELQNFLYTHTLYDGVQHLLRVAAGLDSMILGEAQVLSQIKEAYLLACDNGFSNFALNSLFQTAITVGKRTRTETDIDRNAVSIGSSAVELAKQIFGELAGLSVLVVGAGKMGELATRHMISQGISEVLVSNRSHERAAKLATQFDGQTVPFNDFVRHLETVDIMISCTSAPDHIVKAIDLQKVARSREGRRPLFLIDIAIPRDIDPEVGAIDGVELYDIDDLQDVIETNVEEREKEVVKVEKIIDEELKKFFNWLNTRSVVPTIVALKDKVDQIKNTKLKKALDRMGDISDDEAKIIRSLFNSTVNQILHDLIINLKEYAAAGEGHVCAEVLKNLFDLRVDQSWAPMDESMEES